MQTYFSFRSVTYVTHLCYFREPDAMSMRLLARSVEHAFMYS